MSHWRKGNSVALVTLSVKNLLTVLSSRFGRLGGLDGGLGSTRPAATEDKVMDKRAEETRSD